MSNSPTEIPLFQDRLQPVIGRLRLLSEYLEQPSVTEYEAASDVLRDCANMVQGVMDDFNRANSVVYKKYGCCGKVSVSFTFEDDIS